MGDIQINWIRTLVARSLSRDSLFGLATATCDVAAESPQVPIGWAG